MMSRRFHASASHSSRPHRKALQLCAQVQESLYWILGSEVGHEDLGLLMVVSVEPAPDDSRLLVTLALPEDMDFAEMTNELHESAKAIRSEVAGSINRRKAPELFYRLVPMGQGCSDM
jgi:ribosome-binding factor A